MQTWDKRYNKFLAGFTCKNIANKLLQILIATCGNPMGMTYMSVSPYATTPKSKTPWLNSEKLISCPYLYSWSILERQNKIKKNNNNHSTLFTAAHQVLSRNSALVTDLQRHDTSTSFILLGGSGYLWDRLSSSQSDLRAGQRRLLQQTHHWSRKNWQHWLYMMCCQLKTTGRRGEKKKKKSESRQFTNS